MASRVRLDLDHSRVKLGAHEDMKMLECYEPVSEHLPKIKSMELREDDVLLTSYPKSGTHWLYRVIDMLQRGRAEYYERDIDSVFLDLQRIELLAELASPRLLVSHVPYDLLPRQARDKGTKIVHVYRNPRSVLVSFHCQLTSSPLMSEEDKRQFGLDNMTDDLMTGKLTYNGWFRYMDKVQEFCKANPDHPICHISYEEMTAKPLETVKRLAEFLGKTGTPELYRDIVEACSFKKQKESEETANPSQAAMKFYRKGGTDDWKNYLTVAMDEKLQQALRDRASRCPYSAMY